MKKIAFITYYFFLPIKGGIVNHCYNLAKQLLKRNLEIDIHASRHTLKEKGILKEHEIVNGIRVFRYKNFWRIAPTNYDIIHLHNFNVFPHFWIFLKVFVKRLFKMKTPKIVITLHGGFTPWWDQFSISKRFVKYIYHKTIGKFFLNHVANKIIALTVWEYKQLIKEGIKKERIIIIPNGVEDEAYVLSFQKSSKLSRFKPYLLFLGRISKEKNLEFIIKCITKLYDINLLIAGPIHDETYYGYLKYLIKKLHVENRVHFVGYVKGKKKYTLIDNALAVVLVSHFEGEPIVVKEAMARGKPVIVSNKAALPYVVEHFKNGFVVSSEDEFVNAVKLLMNNENLYKKISENNQIKAKEWQWNIISSKILKVYKEITVIK